MKTTTFDVNYISESLQAETFQRDTTNEIELLEGPKVQFEVEEYDFETLVRRLVEFERRYELSSLEMFSQYFHGNLDKGLEEWLDLFILYLGTHEVRQFSCP